MAVITSAVVVSAASSAYAADQQRSAANEAARRQAEGVRQGQLEARNATERARNVLTGMAEPQQQQVVQRQEFDAERQEILDEIESLENRTPSQRGRRVNEVRISEARQRLADFDRNRAQVESQARAQTSIASGQNATQQPVGQTGSTLSDVVQDAQPNEASQANISQLPADP